MNDYVNFKNIFFSLMTLFKAITSDGASSIMFDTSIKYPSKNFINHFL